MRAKIYVVRCWKSGKSGKLQRTVFSIIATQESLTASVSLSHITIIIIIIINKKKRKRKKKKKKDDE